MTRAARGSHKARVRGRARAHRLRFGRPSSTLRSTCTHTCAASRRPCPVRASRSRPSPRPGTGRHPARTEPGIETRDVGVGSGFAKTKAPSSTAGGSTPASFPPRRSWARRSSGRARSGRGMRNPRAAVAHRLARRSQTPGCPACSGPLPPQTAAIGCRPCARARPGERRQRPTAAPGRRVRRAHPPVEGPNASHAARS